MLGGRRSLSQMRDSLVSVDEGCVINNYFINTSVLRHKITQKDLT